MSKKFTRTIEDFTCTHCGKDVVGNGYTNHCPYCLYSRHVDINPGDRAAVCGGLMKPVRIELKGKDYIIIHKCLQCGLERKNKTNINDNYDNIIGLVR